MLSQADKKGVWLILAVVTALAAVLIAKAMLDKRPKPGTDNCIGSAQASTVIVLDYTEEISEQTKNEIAARAMAHLMENVKVNERVSIFSISDSSKQTLKPLASLCRPPEDGNRVVENVQLIRKRFHEKFEVPIRKILSAPPGNAKESPIAQVLTDLSLSEYLRTKKNTLIVFSDMLEHTSKFSLYKCESADAVVDRYRTSRQGAMERPQFTNTVVKLNLIPRLDQSKTTLKCRDKLWPWFFGNNTGDSASLSVDYLPGGPTPVAHVGVASK